jgi:hypothetical protein
MASNKKPSRKKKVQTVADESYSALEQYCIWLNEYYRSLRKAGFSVEITLSLLMDRESYPDWVPYKNVKPEDFTDEDED